MSPVTTCLLCAVPASEYIGSSPHLFLLDAPDGQPGELWIVPRRHLISCLETKASEWLEVPVLIELAQQTLSLSPHSRGYRIEIHEPAPHDLAPPHLRIRLVPDLPNADPDTP